VSNLNVNDVFICIVEKIWRIVCKNCDIHELSVDVRVDAARSAIEDRSFEQLGTQNTTSTPRGGKRIMHTFGTLKQTIIA
jgi:hypothetical protein